MSQAALDYTEYAEESRREELELLFTTKLGVKPGFRRHPRIRLRKGRSQWWHLELGPFHTKRAAFREARKYRDGERSFRIPPFRRPLVVFQVPPPSRRARPDWYVASRKARA